MPTWIYLILGIVVTWFVGGLLWKKVIRPFFRREVVTIRTSVIPEEHHKANQIEDNMCCFCLA